MTLITLIVYHVSFRHDYFLMACRLPPLRGHLLHVIFSSPAAAILLPPECFDFHYCLILPPLPLD